MIPRTPVGDLVAALVLVGVTALLVYVSVHGGRLGVLDRHDNPGWFWLGVVSVALCLTFVAGSVAWEAIAAMGSG